MLLVRRRAPEGSYFSDGDRASGVFGVLATGFSVLLGFIIFLAFESYDQSRTGAETEALVLVQQVENAQQFPPAVAPTLTGQLVCYGRSVVGVEWPRMQDGTVGDAPNPWALELFDTVRGVEPRAASEQSAYDKWLDQTSTREEARRDRVHGAVGVIPAQLWVVLFFISAVIFAFMLFFADSGERRRDPGDADGCCRLGDHRDAPAAGVPRSALPPGCRRPPAGGDGTLAPRPGRCPAVRRARGLGAV